MQHESSDKAKTGKQIRLAAYLLMGSTALSSVLGYVRDAIFARLIGASEISDVYLASFTIPDLLNRLIAAGALSTAFVPLLANFLSKDNKQLANDTFRAVATIMGTVLALAIVVAEIFAYDLGTWIAPGFNEEQRQLLATLIRIILPAQFFFYWGGLAISVQYTHKRFLFPALAPLIYNIGIISFGVLLHQEFGVMGFSIGVLLGSIGGHGLIQLLGVTKLKYSVLPLFRFTPEIKTAFKTYLLLVIPIMAGFLSFVVADEWFIKYFASFMEKGSVTWLSFARREMILPVNIIAQAAGIASFPFLANYWSQGKFLEFGESILIEIQKLWAAAPLAAVLVGFHAEPMTHIIFFGNKFTLLDVQNTAAALRIFSIGIFFWAVRIILSRAFYATQNTWLPNIIGVALALLLFPIYKYLGQPYGYLGLAIGSALGIGLYAGILGVLTLRLLKKNCPELSFQNFLMFSFQWGVFLLLASGVCLGIKSFGIYQQTHSSAILEIALSSGILIPLGFLLLRTYFKRFSGGQPLF